MKRLSILVVSILLLLCPGLLRAEEFGEIHISYLEGDVQIEPEDGSEWLPASINMPLQFGDRLWVPEEARAEIQFVSGAVIRLDAESALDILTLDDDSAQLYLAQGRAYLNFWYMPEWSLQVDTPLASIRAYDRSIFNVAVAADGATEVAVLKGIVDAESRSGTTSVTAGKIFTIHEAGYTDLASLGHPDSWEEWNRDRDIRLAGQGVSSEYLPAELRSYAGDLDAHGQWVYVEGYDYVWTPRVIDESDWAPYRLGRWVWRGSDYVWISYEPWGWVPYHYGRWIFTAAIGWCWVPPAAGDVYWGPGFVSWVHTPAYVAWLPLAPGEVYYGYGYYGPRSVNITQINIYNVRQRIVHKHVHMHRAVTVLSRKAFLSGMGMTNRIKENPFLWKRVSRGRPRWKPGKATRLPVIKDIPQRRLPPRKLKQILVKEVRKERPFIKERKRSVFQNNGKRRPLIVSTRGKRSWVARRGTNDSPAIRTPSRISKGKNRRITSRRAGQSRVVQKREVLKRVERKQRIRDTIQKRERPRVTSTARVRPRPAVQGDSRNGRWSTSAQVKQRLQAQQLKTRQRPVVRERNRKESVQPARPQKRREKQMTRPDTRKYEGRVQRVEKRDRPLVRDTFTRGRWNQKQRRDMN